MAEDTITAKPLDGIVLLARIICLTTILSQRNVLPTGGRAAGNSVEDGQTLLDESRHAFAEVR